MGRQLTHFALVTVCDQIGDADVVNQRCILLTPDADFSKENSSLYHSMNLTEWITETLYLSKRKFKWTLCLNASSNLCLVKIGK